MSLFLDKYPCRAQRQPQLNTNCIQCHTSHTMLLGTTCIRTREPNRRRQTKNKKWLSFLPSASCEIPLDHANPCEPSKNTRASTVFSPNLMRFFVTTFPAAEKTRSDAADEAGIAKYFLANLARVGHANWCRHHQLKSSSPVLPSSLSSSSSSPFSSVKR